jgi:hypothetical protein
MVNEDVKAVGVVVLTTVLPAGTVVLENRSWLPTEIRSALVRVRTVGVAALPDVGPNKAVLAAHVFRTGTRVPDVVTGLPVTAVL